MKAHKNARTTPHSRQILVERIRQGLPAWQVAQDLGISRQLCSAYFEPLTAPALRGLTSSHDGRFHLQSYWVSFEGSALIGSAAFRDWWAEMTPTSDRRQVIERYELRLTEWFMNAGFAAGAAYEPSRKDQFVAICRAIESGSWWVDPANLGTHAQIDMSMAAGLNPTHFLWDVLAERYGVIKIELLNRNPMRLNLHKHIVRMLSDPAYRTRIRDATG